MNVRFFDNRRVRQGLTLLLLAGSLTCIFPPRLPAFQWWGENAVLVAMGFLLLGLFFLVINKSRLMFVCLGCSAAISFFKHEISDPSHFSPSSIPLEMPARDQMHSDTPPSKNKYPADESSETHR